MAKADDTALRLRLLELAIDAGSFDPETTVNRAQTYFDFLNGTTSTAAVAVAAPEPEAPRLDSPAVQAEAAETLAAAGSSPEPTPQPEVAPVVTDRPTVLGNGSTTPAGTSSGAPAVSSSLAAQPTADAPAAATSSPAIGLDKVQAAVIAASKGIGRDATIATLQEHGGARLPDIPVDNHAALFAALNDKLAAAGKDKVSV